MYILSDPQIDLILDDIRKRGIHSEDLQQSLLDHVCIIIERELTDDADFQTCYESVIRTFYKESLQEIEEQSLFLVRHRHHLALSRNLFFLLLFLLCIGPVIGYDGCWLAGHAGLSWYQLPLEVWGGSLVFAIFPLGILLVLFFTPERLDPLIPRGSIVLLGTHPFISIVNCLP